MERSGMIPHVTVYIEKAAAPDALADGAGSRVGELVPMAEVFSQ